MGQRNYRQALPLLQGTIRKDPQNFWAWFLLGKCQAALGEHDEAAGSFQAALALEPQVTILYIYRGLAYLGQKKYPLALQDFNEALRQLGDTAGIEVPNLKADVLINRALAHQGLNQHAEAVQDFTRALELGSPRTKIYFVRARSRERLGDAAGARQDRAEGLRREPADADSWNARGFARLPTDPKGALADFEQALDLEPYSRRALENKAHVLAERLGRTEEAVKALDEALTRHPENVSFRASRGVLLARLGRRPAALRDAEACLLRDRKPATLYQVAGIWALTSRQHAADRRQALHLLASALKGGYGFELLERDGDLGPIRDLPEYRRLAASARELQRAAAMPPPK